MIEIDKQYGTKVTIEKENGIKVQKNVTLNNLRTALMENFQFATGWLPAGTRHYGKRNDIESIIIESPPTVREVQYSSRDGIESFVIPVPWTLWKFSLMPRDNKVLFRSANVWAMKRPITPGSENQHSMYTLPFSNVGGSGDICWGSGSETSKVIETITSINKVGRMIEVFWSAPFNSDLDGDKYVSFQSDTGIRINHCYGLLQHLNNKTTFPYEILTGERSLSNILDERGYYGY